MSLHHQLHFYDSSNPHNVPSGVHAAVPVDGRFKWPVDQIDRMARVIRYTVLGGAQVAHIARAIDIETGDRANDPSFYMPFLIERNRHYGDATAYCDRSTLPSVEQHCKSAGIFDTVRFWTATLDGTQEVKDSKGRLVWAVQYAGGLHAPFDLSVLHGKNDFAPVHIGH